MLITTEQAKAQCLDGADSWKYAHLRYFSDLASGRGAADLYLEAHNALLDCITLKHRAELGEEYRTMQRWFDKLASEVVRPDERTPACPTIWRRRSQINFEYLKIASALEIYIKASLLERCFVVHKIIRKGMFAALPLAVSQEQRPVAVAELLRQCPFHYNPNDKQNFWPCLTDQSLNFSTVLKQMYLEAVGLTTAEQAMIELYRVRRNQVHFPDQPFGIGMGMNEFDREIDFLVQFANKRIALSFNSVNARLNIGYAVIPEIR